MSFVSRLCARLSGNKNPTDLYRPEKCPEHEPGEVSFGALCSGFQEARQCSTCRWNKTRDIERARRPIVSTGKKEETNGRL